MKNGNFFVYSRRVHEVVNDGVDARVGHGEPIKGQKDVLDVLGPLDSWVVVRVNEVSVVGQPAHPEVEYQDNQHFDNLKKSRGEQNFTSSSKLQALSFEALLRYSLRQGSEISLIFKNIFQQ